MKAMTEQPFNTLTSSKTGRVFKMGKWKVAYGFGSENRQPENQ